jgi:hypothetical protein
MGWVCSIHAGNENSIQNCGLEIAEKKTAWGAIHEQECNINISYRNKH